MLKMASVLEYDEKRGMPRFSWSGLNHMPHAVPLGVQVVFVFRVWLNGNWYMLHHIQPMAGKALDFERVIGQQAQVTHAEVPQNLGSHAVVSQIGGKPSLMLASTVS